MRKLLIILGIPIDDLTLPEALDRLEELIAETRAGGPGHQIATVNADFVVKSLHDDDLRRILQHADMATADGMPLVWGARLLGVALEGRVTGADLVPALAERAAEKGYSVFLLGAAAGVAQRAAEALQQRYAGLKIAGVLSPPVQPLEEMDPGIVEQVRAARPDILLVALGNPKQEKWIARHAHTLQVPVMIGVGGTLDFLAGAVRRAPLWMQQAGLEWLFRLLQQPRRLWRRYVIDLFGFSLFFVRQWLAMQRGPAPRALLPASDTIIIERTAIMRLQGRLDTSSVADFRARAEQALALSSRLLLDLSAASFLDSAALGALVALTRRARAAGGDLTLVAVPATITRIMDLLRLTQFFSIQASIEAVLRPSESTLDTGAVAAA